EAPKLKHCTTKADLEEIINVLLTETGSIQQAHLNIDKNLTEQRLEIDKLRHQLKVSRAAAKVDVLTGMNNRQAFDDLLTDNIDQARTSGQPLTLVIVDIDHFNKINTTMGHLIGDKLIIAIGQTLTKKLREDDIAARIGGEEFAVILPDTDLQGAEEVAENIRKAVEKIVFRKSSETQNIINISISGGIAVLQAEDDSESLLKRADQGLYVAKSGGRNQIGFSRAAQLSSLSQTKLRPTPKPANTVQNNQDWLGQVEEIAVKN
ncbi:MAG: GGDEF domain-containing protein, partial [Immundisolibacteraceae bacterium]|nr:GGDEF domain-containing protein [Immundisolibacteraceae bacterium]